MPPLLAHSRKRTGYPHRIPCKKIIVMGESRALAQRLLRKHNFTNVTEAKTWQEAVALSEGCPIVGIGNIKGQAYDMITNFEGGEQN